MRTSYVEAGLIGSATRAQAQHDIWQWVYSGSDPDRGLHEDTRSAAWLSGYKVLDVVSRASHKPCREPFDGRHAEAAGYAAALAVRLETVVYRFDTRHIPTVTHKNEGQARHVIEQVAARHDEMSALNPYAATLLAEASQLLPCDNRMQEYAARTALVTLAVMGRFWKDRADTIADEIWLTGQYEEPPHDV